MRKVLFLLLFLLVLGAASISAQVRIGGDEVPNEAAVLDLNADNENDGIKGLALPRVSLASNDDDLGYSGLLEGMLVYNTNADMTGGDGVGVYYWDGNEWVKPAGGSVYEGSTSIELSGNSFQRAALTGDVTAAANSNTTTISSGAVSRSKTTVITGSVSLNPASSAVGYGATASIDPACGNKNTTFNWSAAGQLSCGWSASTDNITCYRTTVGTSAAVVRYVCFP